AQLAGDVDVAVDVGQRGRKARFQPRLRVVVVDPAPVRRPQVEGQIVHVGRGVGDDEIVLVAQRALATFAAGAHQLLRREAADVAGGLVHSLPVYGEVRRAVGLAAGSRLVVTLS